MNAKLNELLGQELSRRDFLRVLCGTLVIAIGFHNLISYLMSLNRPAIESKNEPAAHGFGASKFGR